MGKAKRNYYIQLKRSFFEDIAIKSMDDSMVIAYQKLLLYVADKDFTYQFMHNRDTIEEELKLITGKAAKTNKRILEILEKNLKISRTDKDTIYFPECAEFTGSIADSTPRTAAWRERHKSENGDAIYNKNTTITEYTRTGGRGNAFTSLRNKSEYEEKNDIGALIEQVEGRD